MNTTREDRKSAMNESSRLSGSGIPKPTAAVKGTAKPTNSVAPMIVKQETEEKPINIEEISTKKDEIEKPKPKLVSARSISYPYRSTLNVMLFL